MYTTKSSSDFPTKKKKCVSVVYGCGVGTSGRGGAHVPVPKHEGQRTLCVHLSHSAYSFEERSLPEGKFSFSS